MEIQEQEEKFDFIKGGFENIKQDRNYQSKFAKIVNLLFRVDPRYQRECKIPK